jgi:hypothetical protein
MLASSSKTLSDLEACTEWAGRKKGGGGKEVGE